MRGPSTTTPIEQDVQDLACFDIVLGPEEQQSSIAGARGPHFPITWTRLVVKTIDIHDALAPNDKACVLSIVVCGNRLRPPALGRAIDGGLQCRVKCRFEQTYRAGIRRPYLLDGARALRSDYDSLDEFAVALVNPPPALAR